MENNNKILLKDSILNYHLYNFYKDFNYINENKFSIKEKISNLSTDSDEKTKENNNNNNILFDYFLYNKENNKFAFFTKNNIIFTNKNGKILYSYNFNNINKFIYFSIDSNNRFCLLIDENQKAFYIDFYKKINILISIDNYSKNFLGGFFIENFDDKVLLLIINKNFFALIDVRINKKEKFYKIYFNKILIEEFYFNLKCFVLILRKKLENFVFINFKNKNCFQKIMNKNIYENLFFSKFYLQNIYNNLYLLKINIKNLVVFKLDNLELMNLGKEIQIPTEKNEVINIENVQVQFNNNLIYLYINKKIYIIDLKNKNNFLIEIIKTDFDENLKIYGNLILFNNKFYKVKFNLNNFYNKNFEKNDKKILIQKEIDLFFLIIRRKNSNDLCIKILKNLLKNLKIQNLFSIFNKILEKKQKLKNKIINEIYLNNENFVFKRKENIFFFDENNLFFLFQNNSLEIEKLFEIFLYLIHLYKIYNIKLNDDNYIYTLIYLVEKIKNYSFFNFVINQNFIKFKEQIGFVLIEKAKIIKEKKQFFLVFNLGLKLIIKNNENYKNVFKELIEKKLFDDALNFLENIFFDKKKLFLTKNYIDYNHLKKFIFEKLVELSKNNIKLPFLYE